MQDRLPHILARQGAAKVSLAPAANEVEFFHLIVPVYREFSNGNLARMVKDLEKQELLEKLRLVFVVNNTREVAADSDSPVRAENQLALKWLKETRFSFAHQVIDLSSEGIERNMGIVRQRGVSAVALNARSNPTGHICVHLDADTHIPPDFLKRLNDFYASYQDLDTIFLMRDYEIRNPPSAGLLFSHHIYRSKRAVSDFFNTRATLPYGMATYQISSRFSTLEKVGGFKPLAQDEDTALSHDLANGSRWIQAYEIVMKTEDRDREDGFTSMKRLQEINSRRVKKTRWKRVLNFLMRKPFALGPPSLAEMRNVPMKPFFINFQLFHALCVQIFTRVQSGEISYPDAVEVVRQRMEKVLLRPIEVESRRFFSSSLEELRAMPSYVELWHKRDLIRINAVAHAFPDLILAVGFHPGTDLWEIVKPHLPASEITWVEGEMAAKAARHDAELGMRLAGLEQFFAGQEVSSSDAFLLWCGKKNEELESCRKKVLAGELTSAQAIEWLKDIFGDWLVPYDCGNYAREADALRVVTSLLIRSRTSVPPVSALEEVIALLQDGPQWVGRSDLY